jgi:N-acetyl-gamma-glutamyl-phosphate/LysW-gamma-L-alpha-aminoadipyl-6-phosphate reductase
MVRVSVAGGAGYLGGELVRLLLGHPMVEIAAVTSSRLAGKKVDTAHPNLRGVTDLRFTGPDELAEPDVLMLTRPHREAMRVMAGLLGEAKQVIDLSGDFRLRDPATFAKYYGVPHAAPELLGSFVPGLPELYREQLQTADRIAVPGCMATAGILALAPLRDLLDGPVDLDARTGSSGSGAAAGDANLHAERSGAMRVFAPAGHRHEAEIAQATGLTVRMSATGVEAVRGVQILARSDLRPGVGEGAIRSAYRSAYEAQPFIRLVAHRRGIYRYPEPKILLGSNFCDVGFALDAQAGRITVIAALDNLVKGGAGNALQCLNIRLGWPERLGLEFPGLHPN